MESETKGRAAQAFAAAAGGNGAAGQIPATNGAAQQRADDAVAAPEAPEGGPAAPQHAGRRAGPRRGAVLLANLRWLLAVLLIVFFIRTFIGEATIIPTASMERTILVGDHVFLNKLLYGPHIPFSDWKLPAIRRVKRQDIVAFRYPRDPALVYVKRVIGLPGDRLEILRSQIYVNGRRLDEPYVTHTNPGLRENYGPITVASGQFFVMGDNRDNSHDSRFWGAVPEHNIVGSPLMVYWSYEAPSDAWLREGAVNRARFYASVATNFFSKTRWARTGLTF